MRVFEKLCDENRLEKNTEMILLEQLALNLSSADYSAHMTSWTKIVVYMKYIALWWSFSLVLMSEVVYECAEIFSRTLLHYFS